MTRRSPWIGSTAPTVGYTAAGPAFPGDSVYLHSVIVIQNKRITIVVQERKRPIGVGVKSRTVGSNCLIGSRSNGLAGGERVTVTGAVIVDNGPTTQVHHILCVVIEFDPFF
jgi:hypothetical protein